MERLPWQLSQLRARLPFTEGVSRPRCCNILESKTNGRRSIYSSVESFIAAVNILD